MFDKVGLEKRWGFLLSLPLLLSSCCGLQAQIKLQPEYASGQPVIVDVAYPDAPEGATPVDLVWIVSGDAGYKPLSPTSIAIWPKYGLKDYSLRIFCSGPLVDANGKYLPGSNRSFEAVTKILGVSDEPKPPTPDPGPTPDPTPDPDTPAPIPEAGFRVLIVYESKDLLALPSWVWDKDFRDYLDSHCVKAKDGKTPEWRIVDPDVTTGPSSALWARALARKRESVPWILVSNGKQGAELPLPKTKAETLELLKKYGGQ